RLRHIKVAPLPISRAGAAAILSSDLGDAGAALTPALETEPCWNTLARCAWRAEYQGRSIVVQLARDPIPDAAFESLEQGLQLIEENRLRDAAGRAALRQFREWVRLSDSPARERSYLDALHAARESSLAQ